MDSSRRAVVAVAAALSTAGCASDGGDGTDEPSPGEPTPAPTDCDPDEVRRPPIVRDTDHSPTGYGTKPQTLVAQSVADYLADFETGFAWNRMLEEHSPLTNVGVDTTTPWEPEPAGDGFVAWSRIETSYVTEGSSEPVERAYVANYYVSAGPVYRVETESDPVDPRERSDRQLVQCGTGE